MCASPRCASRSRWPRWRPTAWPTPPPAPCHLHIKPSPSTIITSPRSTRILRGTSWINRQQEFMQTLMYKCTTTVLTGTPDQSVAIYITSPKKYLPMYFLWVNIIKKKASVTVTHPSEWNKNAHKCLKQSVAFWSKIDIYIYRVSHNSYSINCSNLNVSPGKEYGTPCSSDSCALTREPSLGETWNWHGC